MHSKTPEQVEHEYEHFDFPFRYYFEGAKASWERSSDGGIIVTLDMESGTQEEADKALSDFLVEFNQQRPGIAIVLDRRLPSTP